MVNVQFSSLIMKNPNEPTVDEESGVIDETESTTTYKSFRRQAKRLSWTKKGKY